MAQKRQKQSKKRQPKKFSPRKRVQMTRKDWAVRSAALKLERQLDELLSREK